MRTKYNPLKSLEKENPEKYKVWNTVAQAIKIGKLVSQPCIVCGEEKSHAHHEDYSKPLEVIWYCPQHHRDRHKEIDLEKLSEKFLMST